jgi:uncharacterized protein YjbI with pentapeptide repeats
MADPEHLEILKQGSEVWNRWRHENPEIKPDLSDDIVVAMLRDFDGAPKSDFSDVDLSGINLNGCDISFANFSSVRLKRAEFRKARMLGANLSGADLWGANLFQATATSVDLSSADLTHAELRHVDFTESNFSNADVTYAWMGHTILDEVDLSNTRGLDTIWHDSSSVIGINTIYRSKGMLPKSFLRGCGVAESFIVQIPALVAAMQPIQFYTCFISYSSKDQEFAERLHTDLQVKGVRVWFAPHDLPIGARIRPAIDESIRLHDKLLLVLSETSVGSQWVEQEVETALARERKPAGMTVLFPVRIDDAIMQINTGWPAYLKNTRNVGDFTRWKDHDSYREALDRLLRDLKAEM